MMEYGLGYQAEHNEIDRLEALKDDFNESHIEYKGRMSPMAKENVYRDYLKGTSVRDISLKYGILPQRVKCIVF